MGYRHMAVLALVVRFSSEPDSAPIVAYITILHAVELFLSAAKSISTFVVYFSSKLSMFDVIFAHRFFEWGSACVYVCVFVCMCSFVFSC